MGKLFPAARDKLSRLPVCAVRQGFAKTRAIPHRDRFCFETENSNGAETQPPHIAGPLALMSSCTATIGLS